MEVKLKVLAGATAGREIKLPPQTKRFSIGRGEECHLRPKSDLISRQHCTILIEDAKVFVLDQSKNGTFVNEQRIAGQQELQPGDRLKIGQLEFEVQFALSVSAAKKPKVKDVADAAARTVKGGGNSDADVMSWLEDEEAFGDTRRYMADTSALLKSMQPETPAEPDPDATIIDDASNPRIKAIKKEPGKLPEKQGAPPPKDSREAALNSLKKIFKQ